MAAIVNPADTALVATSPRLVTVNLGSNLNLVGSVGGVSAGDVAKKIYIQGSKVFSETWDGDAATRYTVQEGNSGEVSTITAAAQIGNRFLRVGNNTSPDQIMVVFNELIPFDATRLYRIQVIARRSSAGTNIPLFAGYIGMAADGVTPVSYNGATGSYGNAHNHAVNGTILQGPTAWTTFEGFTQGTAATGDFGVGTRTAPSKVHTNVKFLRPYVLCNFGVAGTTEINAILIDDITDVAILETKTDQIGSSYVVKLTTEGLVGGFGLYNTGSTVTAGFDVDEFYIGKTVGNRVKPFVLSGGVVYIDSARIADLSVTNAKIANLSVDNAKIANLAVDGAKIANLAVGTAKIADLAVDNSKIANLAVDNAKIANLAVNSAKIADLAINSAKIDNTIQSTNYSATDGWQINKAGTAIFNQLTARGSISGATINAGAMTGYAWPASGTGAHLSGSGLLVGNPNNVATNRGALQFDTNTGYFFVGRAGGQYIELSTAGVFTVAGDIITSGNIKQNNVTIAYNTETTAASLNWSLGPFAPNITGMLISYNLGPDTFQFVSGGKYGGGTSVQGPILTALRWNNTPVPTAFVPASLLSTTVAGTLTISRDVYTAGSAMKIYVTLLLR